MGRGFTLIELLVVIAIIGVLSSVVLASLNTARNRGADAAVRSNLANARAEAELFFDTGSSYGALGGGAGVCASTGSNIIGDNVLAAINASGSAATLAASCFTAGGTTGAAGSWASSVALKTAGSGFYCVDSRGAATTTALIGISATDTVCGTGTGT